jgi:hypothetical protein
VFLFRIVLAHLANRGNVKSRSQRAKKKNCMKYREFRISEVSLCVEIKGARKGTENLFYDFNMLILT